MKETEAKDLLSTQDDQGVDPMKFIENDAYTTFRAEHAIDGNDLVFHFFRHRGLPDKFWKDEGFPQALSDTAMAVFQATYPRLKATYTSEVDSWWMRASGFAVVGLPEERIERFYEKLDEALEKAGRPA